MPAIKARKQADGSTRYTVVVRIRQQGKVLHQEAKTFAFRSAAERWGKQREVALEDPAALV
ncbi:MAG: site-specific integrase, partial [Steroidobacteraceae bacterium]